MEGACTKGRQAGRWQHERISSSLGQLFKSGHTGPCAQRIPLTDECRSRQQRCRTADARCL